MAIDNFIPEIWANEVLRSLEKNLVYGQVGVINRNYEGEVSAAGDTVRINEIGPVTVKAYTKNADIDSPETLTDAQQVMTISEQDYFNFQIDDVDKAQQRPKIMQAAMAEASYAMRDRVDQYIAALYANVSAANKLGTDAAPKVPNLTQGDDQNIYNLIEDCGTLLSDSRIPKVSRWMIVPPWIAAMIAKDIKVSYGAAGSQMAANALLNGFIGHIGGFDILESHNVPNTAGAKYKILFGTSQGITFADQINKVEAFRPEKRFADAVKGLHVYGAKVVRPEAVGCLTVSKT